MKKEYLTPAIQVIALDNTSPIMQTSTISGEGPGNGSGTENTGTGFIGFGEGECENPE